MRSPFAALLLLAMLAGCAAPASVPHGAATLPRGSASAALCDVARSAAAHRPSGAPAAFEGAAPIPCLSRTGYRALEPTLGVASKTGHIFYYPTVTGRFDPVGMMRSDDAGATWTRVLPSGPNGQATHYGSADAYFYLDPRTDRIFADDLQQDIKCSVLSFSDDEGKTWTNSVAGCSQFDHATLFAGKPVSSRTSGYPDVVYHCAYRSGTTSYAGFGAGCEKSTDGGMAWLPTGAPISAPTFGAGNNGEPLCNGALGHGTVGPDGSVLVPHGLCGVPTLAISRDEGATWTNVKVSDLGMPFDGDDHGHDAAVGVDPAGNVYYGWTARDRMPYLSVSRDGGRTWSAPVKLAPPLVTEVGNFEMAVGGVGKIAFVFMGSTNSPGAPFSEESCVKDPPTCLPIRSPTPAEYRNVSWDGYMGESDDALASDPVVLTATVNPHADPLVRGVCGGNGRCQEEYDFLDVRIGPDGTPWASLVDGCGPACAADPHGTDDIAEGVVGHLAGGPSLWDAAP